MYDKSIGSGVVSRTIGMEDSMSLVMCSPLRSGDEANRLKAMWLC